MELIADEDLQPELFENERPWEQEWQGMPEFVQERRREYAKLIIRFRNQEDLDAFATLIGQRLNRNSQCTWYPEFDKAESGHAGKVYVDES